MRVNKNLLLQKSNEELEKYLLPNGGYVTDAIEYAVEILKNRGYEFSEEQNTYIQSALAPKEKKQVNSDYILASNLILASAALGGIIFIFLAATMPDFSIFTGLFSLLIIAGFGLLARTGTTWLKYVLIAFLLIGLVGLPFMITFYLANPIIGMANLIQTILQGTSIFFLFTAATKDSKLPITFPPTPQS